VSPVALAGLVGWPLGAAAVTWALLVARGSAARRESVARACHELRGPITAARLGVALVLRNGELPAAALRAIDLELSRAALALDDLARPVRRSNPSTCRSCSRTASHLRARARTREACGPRFSGQVPSERRGGTACGSPRRCAI
jgi:signal transduction histidine kinase